MTRRALLAALAILPALPALADGPPPPAAHGGVVAEATSHHWVELVVRDGQLVAYVIDSQFKPVPSAQLGGKATVLVGGKREEVTLAPGNANTVTGKLAAPVPGKMTAVLALTINGKPATVRFTMG